MIFDSVEQMQALLKRMADMVVAVSAEGGTFDAWVSHPRLVRPRHVRHLLSSMSALHRIAVMRAYWRVRKGRAANRIEVLCKAKTGSSVWLEADFIPLPPTDGKHGCIAAVFRDVTDRKAEEERLRQLAFHDALTGLPNRRLFMEHVKLSVNHAKRHNKMLALLHIDIDDFKTVNDSYGHDAGDKLLRAFAQRLRHCIREIDTFARIGGDEFMILLNAIDSIEGVIIVVERLYRLLERPIDIGGGRAPLQVGVSMGIAVFPEHGTDKSALIKNADMALYEVKRKGKNSYKIYRAEN